MGQEFTGVHWFQKPLYSVHCYYRQTHGKKSIFFIQDRLW